MLLFGLLTNPLEFIIYIVALIIALTIHEAAHAYMSYSLGDDTAKLMGRLTLNPLAHLDLWGSIFMLLVGFGWGKPVMVNPRKFQNPKLDNLTVALAGPISNFLLAAVAGLVIRFIPMSELLTIAISILVFFNLTLMMFNLLPIPPLDGSKILALFMPETAYIYFQQIGFYILIVLLVFSSEIPVIKFIMEKAVNFIFTLLTGAQVLF